MRRWLIVVAALLLAGAAAADPLLGRIGEPGVHAAMRHALAPGYSDPPDFALRDCATQRNLDARGRAQARAAGAMLRAAGARVDRLYSSQWCRCLETARLMEIGPVIEAPPLNSFFEARARRASQTAETMALLRSLPEEQSAFLVTHQVNVSALAGRGVGSGEIVVFRLTDAGVEVLGRRSAPVPD
jgi:phosphohistidine phosphatase SixA